MTAFFLRCAQDDRFLPSLRSEVASLSWKSPPATGFLKNSQALDMTLGVVFSLGVLFLSLSMLGVREKLLEAISPSMRNGIAIGLFIVLIGMRSAGLLHTDPGSGGRLNPQFASPDLIVFFVGLLVAATLHARRVRGAIVRVSESPAIRDPGRFRGILPSGDGLASAAPSKNNSYRWFGPCNLLDKPG
jgi:xanthine/uracil/vitamin C permease (AzgA family)